MALVVTIDGVDLTSLLVHETLAVNQTNDGLNSTCEFDLINQEVIREDVWTVGITHVTIDGDVITGHKTYTDTKVEVSIVDGATVYFAGIVSRISTRHMGSVETLGYVTPETEVLHFECHDFNALLEESVIDTLEEYGAKTDEELIDDIFPKYVTGIDFATFVAGGAYVFAEIAFEGITVRQFLDTICAQSRCIWYVDYSKKLHYALAEANAPAWHLSDTPDNVNSFEYFDDITKELDATNLVNRVFVVGGPVSLWFIDLDSIGKYGSHRAIVQDTSLVDIDDIEGKGNAVLAKFKDPVATYKVRTYKAGLRAGMHVRLVSAFYDVDEELLISNLMITFPVDRDPVYEITCGGLDSSASSSANRGNLDDIHIIPPILPSQLPLASRGWGHDLEFSALDRDTVEWTAGTITTVGGNDFNINAGNTDDPGAMAGVVYVYLDVEISLTELQVTSSSIAAVGANRIIVAVCAPNGEAGKDALFQVFGGGNAGAGVFIVADNIAANSITANEIQANTITAAEIAVNTITADRMNVGQLSAIVAHMGVLTAGEIKMYAGAWGAATGFRIVTTEICGRNAGVDQFKLDAATGRITAINVDIGGTITIGNPGDIDGSTINNDDGWTDDTAANAANAHRLLGVTGTWARTDADTITWTGVVLRLGNGSNVNILNGNTGNMAAKSYLYYNGTTTLQITTNPNVIGGTHTLVAVAQNGATLANIQIVGGGTYISGDWINTGTITAALLNVAHLSAITANMGTLTAGTIQTAAAGNDRVVINIADGIRGIDAADVVQFQLDPADGKAYAGAGAVWLDGDGLSLEYNTAKSKVAWRDGAGNALASLHSELYGLQVGLLLHCDPITTQGSFISIRAKGGPAFSDSYVFVKSPGIGFAGYVHFNPKGVGADVTTFVNGVTALICLEAYTKIYNDLRVQDGLYVGSIAVNPGTGDAWIASDVRVGGGLYVGSTGINPAPNDIRAAGQITADGLLTGSSHVAGAGVWYFGAQGSTYYLHRSGENLVWHNASGDHVLAYV